MKGIYNIGNIKRTEGQEKKHVLQMSDEEKKYLKDKIKAISIKDIIVSHHILNKRKEIGFEMDNIYEVLNEDKIESLIIEYNETPTNGSLDKRVLLRGCKSYNTRFKTKNGSFISPANICFVMSLDTYRIVTVYWNKVGDSHKSINWNRYNKDLSIIKES